MPKRENIGPKGAAGKAGDLWKDHDLHPTCATLLLGKGVHVKLVQELLGHPTITVTLDTYSHVLPGTGNGLADTMDEAFG